MHIMSSVYINQRTQKTGARTIQPTRSLTELY